MKHYLSLVGWTALACTIISGVIVVLFELLSSAFWLLNQPSNAAVLAGVFLTAFSTTLLIVLTMITLITINDHWW